MFKTVKTLFALCAIQTSARANPLQRRSQCAATLSSAESVANRLQSHSWDPVIGSYTGGSLWTDANALEDLHNLMLGANIDTYSSVADLSEIGMTANTGIPWSTILDGSWDDAQWVMLALWKMADYKAAKGDDNSAFLSGASSIYDLVAGQWDSTCGGGVWWSSAHTYKNSITNELFLYTSAEGYIRNKNSTYLSNAKAAWSWLGQSGLRNLHGLYNDGLDMTTCKNNGETTWTYNQGVVASGLAALYATTGDLSLLDQAEITLDATIQHLTSNGILKEGCDDAQSGGTTCNVDQQIFKGVWTKHLQYYLDLANSASRTAKYSPFLGAQYSAVYRYGTNADDDVSNVWYAANAGGESFSPMSSTSGLEAEIAAAKYGPC